MQPLSLANVESELSYAYLHAIAAHAKCSCNVTNRHEDNTGVDARLVGWGPFPGGGYRTEIDIKVQLKATIAQPAIVDNCLSYSLKGISQYNDLKSETVATPRILVVLFLPSDHKDWVSHSEDALSLHRCAYWVSLRGAPDSSNTTSQTIYIPQDQKFDTAGLISLMTKLSKNDIPKYKEITA